MREVINFRSRSLFRFFKKCFSLRSMHSDSTVSIFSNQSTDSGVSNDHTDHLKKIQIFIPKLTSHLHKGQCGRVGVIGGSFEYTGAPYFAAISSLRLGADLVHVFCCQAAGPVIKSYSPELIVHPFLDSADVVKKIEPWLEKLHVLVIGPGMGREKDLLKNVGDIITYCKKKMKQPLPLVIDADGLHLITEDFSLIKGYKGPLILTPNSVEFTRLSVRMSEIDPLKIATSLNAVILQKGLVDVIINGMHNHVFQFAPQDIFLRCDVPGSNRRCGGQGDILSGCIATFVAWLQIYFKCNSDFDLSNIETKDKELLKNTFMKYSLAVYGACTITRTCSRLAFELNGRGMMASDMISFISKVFTLYFV